MNICNIKQLEENILNIFIHNNFNISNEDKKNYIINLTHFFDIIHNKNENNKDNNFKLELDNAYNYIKSNYIYNCIIDDIDIIYNNISYFI